MASKITSSGYIPTKLVKLFYEREGNEKGRTVLFVHGLGGTSNAFQPLVSGLQEFDLVRFDWSGHGRSGVPSTTSIESYVEDCEAVINHLGLKDLVVVGHSLGGLISLHLAAKRQDVVKGLVLFGPVQPPPEAGQKALATRSATAKEHGMAAVADMVVSNAFAADSFISRKGEVALAREMLTRQDPVGYALAVEALAKSSLPAWDEIKCKVSILSGEEDKVSTVAAGQVTAVNIGTNALQAVWKGVGHWHMLENSDESVNAIKSLVWNAMA